MSFYDAMAETAKNLIAQYGAIVTIERDVGRVVDAVAGTVTPDSVSTYKANGLFVEITQAVRDSFGGNVESGDRAIILDAVKAVQIGDRPLINGNPWRVVELSTLSPAGTPLVYRALVRK
jgi:hypothetical protein